MSIEEDYKLIIEAQQQETQLSWSRNSYFLVTFSLLLVSFSGNVFQVTFKVTDLLLLRILISVSGVLLSVIWVLMNVRSYYYVGYYKEKAKELSSGLGRTHLYLEDNGYKCPQIRTLNLFLPSIFVGFWVTALIFSFVLSS